MTRRIATDPWGLPVYLRFNYAAQMWELWRCFDDFCSLAGGLSMQGGATLLVSWLNSNGVPTTLDDLERLWRINERQR